MALVAVASAPEPGQLVRVRDRLWVVTEVRRSTQPIDPLALSDQEPQNVVALSSVEDDGLGEELTVVWEVEVAPEVLESSTLPSPAGGRFDDPQRLDAFLDAVRWGAITSADHAALQAPFRSGITIEDYQLDPVVRALRMPRANLLIADDVGLGKTIEAGLVIQELLLRHRARSVLVVCPASLCLKWQAEMQEKFGLEFRIVNSEAVSELRRTRGMHVNPWTSFPRLITSIDWLKRDRPMRLMREVLPASRATYPRAFDLLVIDEVHTVAPAARGRYAIDSDRTKTIEEIAPHFEHRLFLSATPHNGYRESFTGLLEMLDNQRFARGVAPSHEQLVHSMVRRLKSDLRDLPGGPDGTPRFARREIVALDIEYAEAERQAHADLVAYTNSRRLQAAGTGTAARAADFVTLLLKKRLFSSPLAFAKTLGTHMATLARRAAGAPSGPTLGRVFDRVDEEFDDDEDLAEATEDALAAAARSQPGVTAEQRDLLRRMRTWAEGASGRLDSKGERLVAWLDDIVRPAGRWSDQRVILFTEYRDTQRWLADHLTARGLGGDRLALLYGGMDDRHREQIKAEFQTHPSLAPVRILLATDAASEGIDLQRHCWRLLHVEIPFSPTRLEQRNGRVDRHGQPNPVVIIHHFAGAEWHAAEAGSFEADLEFLSRALRKVEAIRDDLGSAAPIVAEQIEERMLGRRVDFDESAVDKRRGAPQRLLRVERDLREEVARLRERLGESRETLHISAANIERVVGIGLELGNQAPLTPTTITRPAGDTSPVSPVFDAPPLSHGWSRTLPDLAHPVTGQRRALTFEHAVADGQDDVVLLHLGHPLVQMAVRLLRAEVWSSDPTGGLSRVTARVVADEALDDVAAVAHGRLVLVGADGHRLHEEVFSAGGRVRNGRFARFERIADMDRALAAATDKSPATGVLDRLAEEWNRVGDALYASVQVRAGEREESLRARLQEREERDVESVRGVLEDLRTRILDDLDEPETQQLALQLDAVEQDQLRRDLNALRARVEAIPAEIEREVEHIRARYAQPRRLVFPAAVSFLVPERLAGARS